MDPSDMPTSWPGSAEHQRLLRAMTAYHAWQPWALAFIVFGSVGRGNWHADSDLDLDVVIADDAQIEPVAEIMRLCEAIGEQPALIAPRSGDDGEVVLASLADFSIRYHPMAATSPNIISSMQVLWGRLTEEQIRAAGLANAQYEAQEPATLERERARPGARGEPGVANGLGPCPRARGEQSRGCGSACGTDPGTGRSSA